MYIVPPCQVKVMCGTVEYVAPEIVTFDCVSTATGLCALFHTVHFFSDTPILIYILEGTG